ncbi:ATP-binding cassette domain-containing protein [Streptomyces sp. NPDC050095]|uniref:ABC transporter ATP-binding protein n=1 Tax=unclassified Streptomyces TaxID=2593676 RepID=UPI00342505B3
MRSAPSPGLVALRNAGRRYGPGGRWVLRGVDLDVPAGALVRVQGANGTGKSTLLRLVAGIDAPSEGRLVGRPRTAYVPERFPAALPFTALGYLTHLGRVHGLVRKEATRRAAHWLERFGAEGYARTPLAELSKGSSQKVAVAQALLAAPELLVLDEAWTGLDAAARDELDRAVAERTAAGAAVLFVDHDPRRLADVTDATYLIEGATLRDAGGVVGGGAAAAGESEGEGEGEGEGGGGGGGGGAGVGQVVVTATAPVASGADSVPGSGTPELPGLPEPHTLTRLDPRTVRVTVPADRSDAVLRTFLNARPPWHVVSVRSEPAPTPPESR